MSSHAETSFLARTKFERRSVRPALHLALQRPPRRADPPAMALRSLAWTRLYYAATLAFALADGIAGANVRAVGFAAWPELRTLYYLVCGACWWIVWRFPAWSAPVTLVESGVNLTVLCAAVLFAPWLTVEGSPAAPPSFGQLLANFAIAGTAGTLAFHQALSRLPEIGGGTTR
jgi:hypothetical protein